MLDKNTLREKFAEDYEKYYSTELFKGEGFERKKCKLCGKYFWTLDKSRELCGDPEHEPYTFFKKSPIKIDYVEFWNKFAEFFKKEGHVEIEKYPVVSRWRPDLYFTIASIQDFQRLDGGKISFEYPANPLIVPQICLRFNDIPNVGITGRHLTSFMMAGQHSFDYPENGYWRDRTIELNFRFLTEVMGIEKSKITYIEDVWAMGDFSEFGPDLESFAYGLELVNSVFTEFAYSNGKISELKNKVVDVGWGFERLIWFASGEYTLYDAIFHNELDYLYKKLDFTPDKNAYSKVAGISGLIDLGEDKNGSKKELELVEKNGVDKDTYYKSIKPIQALYAIVDHTRTLLFAINDGALPSNVGGGYNLRILLRRIFNFIDTYDFKFDLMKLFELHAKDLEGLYPNLSESLEDISNIIKIERERYDEMKERSKNKVEQILKKHEEITSDTMRLLYESYGITSDFISMYAKKNGYDISIPDDYIDLIKGDFTEKKKKKKTFDIDVEGLPKTLKLFYDFDNMSDSKVLKVNKNLVVLDRTPFYAESGGQEADHGEMNGIRVLDVQSVGGVIVHVLAESPQFNENEYVRCIVDEDRRIRLMAHHTATHLVSAAARSVLGKHAWQEGAHKGEDKAHIDIAHYDKLNDQQIKEIESKANSYIFHGMKVSLHEMNRGDAESEFGFSIYQGHGTPSTKLRIITIKNLNGELIDAEACGGLHLINRESLIGIIKIVKSSRIHDGIDRIEFTAGPASLDYTRSIENSINHVSKIFGIDEDKIDEGVESKIRELKDLTDYSKSMENKIIRYESEMLSKENDKIIVKEFTDYRPEILRQIALDTVKRSDSKVVILYNHIGNAVISAGKESDVNAIEYIKDYSKKNKINFRGGGSASIAEGKFEFSDSEKDKV